MQRYQTARPYGDIADAYLLKMEDSADGQMMITLLIVFLAALAIVAVLYFVFAH